MAWLTRGEDTHSCLLPTNQPIFGRQVSTGATWQCPECEATWRLHIKWAYNRIDYLFEWTPLTS